MSVAESSSLSSSSTFYAPLFPPYIVAVPGDRNYTNVVVFVTPYHRFPCIFPTDIKSISYLIPEGTTQFISLRPTQYLGALKIYIGQNECKSHFFCCICCRILVDDGNLSKHSQRHLQKQDLLKVSSYLPGTALRAWMLFLLKHFIPISATDDYLAKHFLTEHACSKTIYSAFEEVLSKFHQVVKGELKEAEFVSILIDGVSKYGHSFIGFMLRFFTPASDGNLILRCVLVHMKSLSDHCHDTVGDEIVKIAKEYDIVNKICAVGADGTAANPATANYLIALSKEFPELASLSSIVLDQCCLHQLSLVYEAHLGEKLMKNLDVALDAARFLHYSNRFSEFLKGVAKTREKAQKIVKTATVTRFASAVPVVDSLLENKENILTFFAENEGIDSVSNHRLTEADFKEFEKWKPLLDTFLAAMTSMEAEDATLATQYHAIVSLAQYIDEETDSGKFKGDKTKLHELAKDIRRIVNINSTGGILLCSGAVLLGTPKCPPPLELLQERNITRICNFVASLESGMKSVIEEEFFGFLEEFYQNPNHEPVIGDLTPLTDLAKYWYNSQNRYPHLAIASKRLLTMAGHTGSLERSNSTVGRIITRDRARLTDEHCDMLTVLTDNVDPYVTQILGVSREQLEQTEIAFNPAIGPQPLVPDHPRYPAAYFMTPSLSQAIGSIMKHAQKLGKPIMPTTLHTNAMVTLGIGHSPFVLEATRLPLSTMDEAAGARALLAAASQKKTAKSPRIPPRPQGSGTTGPSASPSVQMTAAGYSSRYVSQPAPPPRPPGVDTVSAPSRPEDVWVNSVFIQSPHLANFTGTLCAVNTLTWAVLSLPDTRQFFNGNRNNLSGLMDTWQKVSKTILPIRNVNNGSLNAYPQLPVAIIGTADASQCIHNAIFTVYNSCDQEIKNTYNLIENGENDLFDLFSFVFSSQVLTQGANRLKHQFELTIQHFTACLECRYLGHQTPTTFHSILVHMQWDDLQKLADSDMSCFSRDETTIPCPASPNHRVAHVDQIIASGTSMCIQVANVTKKHDEHLRIPFTILCNQMQYHLNSVIMRASHHYYIVIIASPDGPFFEINGLIRRLGEFQSYMDYFYGRIAGLFYSFEENDEPLFTW